MSCIISIADRSGDIWKIRNTIYEWFVRLLSSRFLNDVRLLDILKRSEYVQGLMLEEIQEEDPALALHVVDALLPLAREVASGQHALVDHYGRPWPELQTETEQAFVDLVMLLVRYRKELVRSS